MLNPAKITRPGEFIQEYILNEFDLTTEQLAKLLNLSEKRVTDLLNNQAQITADIALRLGRFTQTSPQVWLNLQNNSDLWDVQHQNTMQDIIKITPYSLNHLHTVNQ
jgi:addiction module HigA family antidote